MKNNKVFSITVICITLLVTSLFMPILVHAFPNSFDMYVTVDEKNDDVSLKVYLAGSGSPLSEATVEYELFTAQGLPLGVMGEMTEAASGTWHSSPLPLTGNQGEVCAVVRANPRKYLPQEKRYYFPSAPAVTPLMDESYNTEQKGIYTGQLAIRMEFAWDDTSGTFQTVNLYSTDEVEDFIADMEQVLARGADGDGLILGRDCGLPYYYWENGASWHTLAGKTRYKGYDSRAEAVVSRGDNLYTQGCADGYTRVASYEPWVAIVLANGWKVEVTQEYTQWGHEVKITAPISSPSPYRESWIYGDPHLLQAGGTQQQELAAIGEYVFDLGGYTLTLFCMKSNAGFSLVTDLRISGPNGYALTIGRNGEVKISGGSDGDPQAIPSLSGDPEIEFIEAPTSGATLNTSEVSIKVEANEFLQQATLHFGEDSYPMTDMDGDKGLRWEKSLSGLTADTYLFHVTGVDLGDNPGTSSEWQVSLQAGAYNITLAAGWNLVSLPLIPGNTATAAVISAGNLASGNVNNLSVIYLYDTATTNWKSWVNGAGTLTTMEDGPAYWIYANDADTLTVHGTEAASPNYPVLTGWNMVGFTSTNDMALEAYLDSIDGDYVVVYRWNAVAGEWSSWTEYGNTFDTLNPGCGYWLYMNADGTITPP